MLLTLPRAFDLARRRRFRPAAGRSAAGERDQEPPRAASAERQAPRQRASRGRHVSSEHGRRIDQLRSGTTPVAIDRLPRAASRTRLSPPPARSCASPPSLAGVALLVARPGAMRQRRRSSIERGADLSQAGRELVFTVRTREAGARWRSWNRGPTPRRAASRYLCLGAQRRRPAVPRRVAALPRRPQGAPPRRPRSRSNADGQADARRRRSRATVKRPQPEQAGRLARPRRRRPLAAALRAGG